MSPRTSSRLLSIGEFAAATQLSPKALRLYDEQRLLPPASIDSTNGYRYYLSDQVNLGRLIRTLREMGLGLMDVAGIVAAEGARAEMLLSQLAKELDRRYAHEKRAFHEALLLLRGPARADAPIVEERMRAATGVAVRAFVSDRCHFVERFRMESRETEELLTRVGMTSTGEPCCGFIDPLSDEEGRLEVLIPIETPVQLPAGVCIRQLPAATCAALVLEPRHTHASDLTAALDALFDWFDRRGHRAIDAPLVSIDAHQTGLRTEVLWAYEPASIPER
ncbi:MAG TPA: MerR family transcriptional regulator [Steroidobacteraceae bacterium]|nr:MerR family transcriptional regulator [Steroidobacteraceae bacterium]